MSAAPARWGSSPTPSTPSTCSPAPDGTPTHGPHRCAGPLPAPHPRRPHRRRRRHRRRDASRSSARPPPSCSPTGWPGTPPPAAKINVRPVLDLADGLGGGPARPTRSDARTGRPARRPLRVPRLPPRLPGLRPRPHHRLHPDGGRRTTGPDPPRQSRALVPHPPPDQDPHRLGLQTPRRARLHSGPHPPATSTGSTPPPARPPRDPTNPDAPHPGPTRPGPPACPPTTATTSRAREPATVTTTVEPSSRGPDEGAGEHHRNHMRTSTTPIDNSGAPSSTSGFDRLNQLAGSVGSRLERRHGYVSTPWQTRRRASTSGSVGPRRSGGGWTRSTTRSSATSCWRRCSAAWSRGSTASTSPRGGPR